MQKSTYTADYDALREQLRLVREKAGLTQRALAARLDVHPSWVAKVETGDRRVDVVEFCWYVSACDTDPAKVVRRLVRQSRLKAMAKPTGTARAT